MRFLIPDSTCTIASLGKHALLVDAPLGEVDADGETVCFAAVDLAGDAATEAVVVFELPLDTNGVGDTLVAGDDPTDFDAVGDTTGLSEACGDFDVFIDGETIAVGLGCGLVGDGDTVARSEMVVKGDTDAVGVDKLTATCEFDGDGEEIFVLTAICDGDGVYDALFVGLGESDVEGDMDGVGCSDTSTLGIVLGVWEGEGLATLKSTTGKHAGRPDGFVKLKVEGLNVKIAGLGLGVGEAYFGCPGPKKRVSLYMQRAWEGLKESMPTSPLCK